MGLGLIAGAFGSDSVKSGVTEVVSHVIRTRHVRFGAVAEHHVGVLSAHHGLSTVAHRAVEPHNTVPVVAVIHHTRCLSRLWTEHDGLIERGVHGLQVAANMHGRNALFLSDVGELGRGILRW